LETITDLQQQKRRRDRLNVHINGEFAFSVHVAIGTDLKIGQDLTRAEVEKIKALDAAKRAQDLSFRFLSIRPRSTSELRSYLRRKGFDQQVTEDTIEHLMDRDYLDDNEFARYWIEQRQTHRPRGTFALRYELLQKGVAREVVDAAVVDVNEKDAALRAVERRSGRWKTLSEVEFRRKLGAYLQRRGFGYETIAEVANIVWLSLEDSRNARHSSH
jgi:regulatory protein